MRIFIIDDDKNFTNLIPQHLNCLEGVDCKVLSISAGATTLNLAEALDQAVKDNDECVFLINANLKIDNGFRQHHKGLELLTWLRVKEVMSHCVLYSFQSAEAIARASENNRLLFSEGVSFVHLPNDFSQIRFKDLCAKKASEDNLKSALKSIFKIGEFRHREANWWGIKQLWDVHKIARSGKFSEPYPSKINSELSILNNNIAKFLYDFEEIAVNEIVKKTNLPKPKQVQIPLSEFLKRINERKDTVIDSEESENIALNDLKDRYQSVYDSWAELNRRTGDPKKEVIVIDDKAKDGWLDIYNHIFGHFINFTKIVPIKEKDENIDKFFAEKIEKEINRNDSLVDLVILDLRLFEEDGKSIKVEDFSGSKVLKLIREKFIGLPVLITTASNKAWTFEVMTKLGADAFWTKEGIDDQREPSETVKNYCELIRLVSKLTSNRYKKLIEFARDVQVFDQTKDKSWLSKEVQWLEGDPTRCDVEKIAKTLIDSVSVLKNYLHNYYLEYGYSDQLNEAFVLSGLINKIAGVYEFVHGLDKKEDYDKKASKVIKGRGDLNAKMLVQLRNESSHAAALGEIKKTGASTSAFGEVNWNTLAQTIDETKKYLETPFTFNKVTTKVTVAYIKSETLYLKLDDGTQYPISKLTGIADQDCSCILVGDALTKYIISSDPSKVFVSLDDEEIKRKSVRKSLGKAKEVIFDSRTIYDLGKGILSIFVNDKCNTVIEVPLTGDDKIVKYLNQLKADSQILTLVEENNGKYRWQNKDNVINKIIVKNLGAIT
jgi:hypothetical protein